MRPPLLEYKTPHLEMKVALPYNLSRDGEMSSHPSPQESEFRAAMMEFSEKIAALYEACETEAI